LATNVGERFDKVDQRFDRVDERVDKLEAPIVELRADFNRMLDLLDAHAKRLDDSLKDLVARDGRVDRLERWIRQIADRTGVRLAE
jgi:hypothetical protein